MYLFVKTIISMNFLSKHVNVGIQVYKQKLKHVLSEHHTAISELKTDGSVSSSLIQNQHTETELELLKETQGLQADVREKELHRQMYNKEMKLVSCFFVTSGSAVVTGFYLYMEAVTCLLMTLNRNIRWS